MPTVSHFHALPSRHLSLREAVTLADVAEERVKKDIERGWIEPIREKCGVNVRLFVRWTEVFSIAAAYHTTFLNSKARSKVMSRWNAALRDVPESALWFSHITLNDHCLSHVSVNLDKYVVINMKSVLDDVWPRVATYARGLSRIERKEDVLGGEPVFTGTRLSVMHVGGMFENGEAIENILEDYPYITMEDVHFARLFYLAHPPLGRPRSTNGCHDVSAERS